MTPTRRKMILEILDGRPDNHLLTYLHFFDNILWADHLFAWLIRQGLKGEKFRDFLEDKKLSPLAAAKYIRQKILLDVEMRPVYASKDYQV